LVPETDVVLSNGKYMNQNWHIIIYLFFSLEDLSYDLNGNFSH